MKIFANQKTLALTLEGSINLKIDVKTMKWKKKKKCSLPTLSYAGWIKVT